MEIQQRKDKSVCSFCKKTEEEVGLVIGKKHVKICTSCAFSAVNRFNKIAEKDCSKEGPSEFKNCPSPHEIKKELDTVVIGQDKAKISLSVAFYNHYSRALLDEECEIGSRKSNVMILGPSGSGKTLALQVLSNFFDVPFIVVDANQFTEAGYFGDDVSEIIYSLFRAADENASLAESGIVYIDEIDKIRKKGGDNTKDVSGEGVQNGLLKIIEGTTVSVPIGTTDKTRASKFVDINTRDILFVCGGACNGLEKIISARLNQGGIGFGSATKKKTELDEFAILQQANASDFIKYGFIPELIGRLPKVVTFSSLNESHLLRILTEPAYSLVSEFIGLFSSNKIDLFFDDEALGEIAHIAMGKNTGARGLRNVMEDLLELLMFNLFSNPDPIMACTITKGFVLGEEEAIIEKYSLKVFREVDH